MGIYIGKVRALESPIRGFKGASGGVIPWINYSMILAIAVIPIRSKKWVSCYMVRCMA